MNTALMEHALRRGASSRARFLKEAEALRRRLDAPEDPSTTEAEREVIKQIKSALEVYVARGRKMLEDGSAASDDRPVWERVEANTAQLRDLCDKLAKAESDALAAFVKSSHDSLVWLEGLLGVSWIFLLGLATIVGLSGYRELLAPLRSQLRQSRAIIERQEKLASLGTLAAGVAHEIRNPLTAINVRVHSLKRGLVPGSSEHEDATVIDSEIKRLEGIVQAFLQFARPAEPKFVTVSADSLLARVRSLFAGQLEQAGIDLILESPPDVWIRVDTQQIEQVLINLVQNAAESIEQEGTIRLRARSETGRLAGRARSVVVLEVNDTGKGIPPEVQKRLFDPFFTTKEEGTGLGLCIAARIVEQQAGILQYTTQVNRGTTFRLILPEAEHIPDEIAAKDSVD
jgi:signal transduction histidine kinase